MNEKIAGLSLKEYYRNYYHKNRAHLIKYKSQWGNKNRDKIHLYHVTYRKKIKKKLILLDKLLKQLKKAKKK